MAIIPVAGEITSQGINNALSELDTRIDKIITEPAEGVSEQEIIDARDGEISLGARLRNPNNGVQFPYFSDDTFDLDYYWGDKKVIVSAGVKNNPFGTGCEVIPFRGKTNDSELGRVWVFQMAVSYGSGGVLGETKTRMVIGDETTNSLVDKSEWKTAGIDVVTSSMLDKNYAIGDSPYLNDDTYDLDYIWDQENYIMAAGVKNNPFPTGGTLAVNRFKTNKSANLTWVTQFVVAYGSHFNEKYRGRFAVRVLAVNEATNTISYMSDWSDERVKPIRILTIGNSFGLDATKYIHHIAQSVGVNVITASLYISGGLLSDHDTNIKNNNNPYRIYNRNHIDGVITDNYVENQSVDDALAMHDYDYVFFNQASAQSGVYSTFQPYLNDIITYVKSKQPNIKVALMPTWAYSSDFDDSRFDKYDRDQITMYNAILDAYKQSLSDVDFDKIIPSGTSIQNARTDTYMLNIERELTRDGYHLSDTGCFIAGLTMFKTLVSNIHIDYVPNGVDKRAAYFGQIAVNNALNNPFKLTNIS